MWKQVQKEDEDIDIQLQKTINWAGTMYQSSINNLSIAFLKNNYNTPSTERWIYDTPENQVSLTVYLDDITYLEKGVKKRRLSISNVAVGNKSSVNEIVAILHGKLKEIMDRLGVDIMYAIWSDDNTEKGTLIFEAATSDEQLRANGFYGSFTLNEAGNLLTYSIK